MSRPGARQLWEAGADEMGSEPATNDAPGSPPSDPPPSTAETRPEPDRPQPPNRTRSWLACVGVVLFFVAADLVLFRGAFSTEPARRVTVSYPMKDGAHPVEAEYWPESLLEHDRRFVVWLLSRNARTWLERPTALYDAEACYPAEHALVLGEPMLFHGLLATPAWALTGEPTLVFNLMVWSLPLFAALAMFLLVRQWTASVPAALVAASLYAFHPYRNVDVLHFYVYDSTPTVLALFFADRWLATGRWRHALALAVATVCQIGGSLYPLVCAAILAPPIFAWLATRHGLRRTHWLQWVTLAALVLGAAALVYAPYLAVRADRALEAGGHFFLNWSAFAPGGIEFAGWSTWLLMIVAIALARRRAPSVASHAAFDASLVVVIGAVMVFLSLLSTGGFRGALDPSSTITAGANVSWVEGEAYASWGNPYFLLSRVIPGLDMVRAPSRIVVGVHLLSSVLAGIGVAALLRWRPGRPGRVAAWVLVSLVVIETLVPSAIGLSSRVDITSREHRPGDDDLAVYAALSAEGVEGPIFEAPQNLIGSSRALAHAPYHRSRTSACSASFHPPERERLHALAKALPSEAAIRELVGLGFEAVAIHHPSGVASQPLARRTARAANREQPRLLRLVAGSERVTIYEIVVEAKAAGGE